MASLFFCGYFYNHRAVEIDKNIVLLPLRYKTKY